MKVRIAQASNKFAGGGEIPPYRTGDPSVLKRDQNNRIILPSFNELFSNHRPEDIYEEEGYIPQEQGKRHQYTYNNIYTDYIGRLNKYNQSLPVNDSANIPTNEKRTNQGLNRIGDTGAMPVVNDMFKGVNTLLGYDGGLLNSNLFPDGGTLEDDDIPMYGSTQQEAIVTGHRMPAWNRFWNKNFRSKSGWDKYVDRYYARQQQMQDTNNTPNPTYEVPDALSIAGIIAGTPYNEDIERAKVWDTYNNWKEHSEIIGPHYDPDGNYHNDAYANPSAGYLSGNDPIGEFFVSNEALGPLAKFIGRGIQQVMAKTGNQWARNQIMGRAFNNAADASFDFNNRFVTTPASSVGYELKPNIRTKVGNVEIDNLGLYSPQSAAAKWLVTPIKQIIEDNAADWLVTPIKQIIEENAANITPKQWTAAQDAAIARGDMAEAQRLRDLHFKVSAPNTKVKEAVFNGSLSDKPFYEFNTNFRNAYWGGRDDYTTGAWFGTGD